MNNKCSTISYRHLALAVLFLFHTPFAAFSQQNDQQESEVFLTFQYRGVVNVYLPAYYKDDRFYLPVGELFSILKIDQKIDQGAMRVSGLFLGEKEYFIDFDDLVAEAGDKRLQLRSEDFLIKDADYFLRQELFNQLFGLEFSVNFNNLTLDLQTQQTMPVVAEYRREQNRDRLDQARPVYEQSYYPLKYDRTFGTLDGGFLDYNLTSVYTPESQLFTFNNAIGAELLGGDIQGNSSAIISDQQRAFTTQNLRWRYVQRNTPWFSSLIAGQTTSEGISNRPITGIKISNKPVESRLIFDQYVIEGEVPPQSEVELYLNNSLIDYQETDNSGLYRFVVPLTYGSTNYSVRVFTPSGQSFEKNKRVQIPFDYVPPGRVDYSISGGQLESPILGLPDRGYLGQASISAGLTNWLTFTASSEYLSNFHTDLPSFTGTLNARLFSNYLLSLNANSENFYRLRSSVVYASGVSWSMEYDYNPGNSILYNIGGSKHRARANIFTPFNIGPVPINIRWSTSYQKQGLRQLLRYRADLSTRIGRLNARFSYTDQQSDELTFTATPSSRMTNSYTYTFGRRTGIPSLLKGVFIRGQVSYLPGLEQLEEVEAQISREVARAGSFQLSYGRNLIGDFNTISLNFTIDFNKVRSNTTTRAGRSGYSVSQNFRGSMAYDPLEKQILLHNRQQVGQSGAAVRLFVDNNNDGKYQPDGDDIIDDPAVRLGRAGGRTKVQGGINYISQLIPYRRYNLEINKSALSNPLLVPDMENFSFVTDPNQYKPIEIPFYLSGVLSGRVERLQDSTRTGLSGIRLNLQSQQNKQNPEANNSRVHNEELRTFSDGSFYTYEVPPGDYSLYIDHTQLDYLDAVSKPDTLEFKVKAKAEGDFIEGLTFTVIPKSELQEDENVLLSDKLKPYSGYQYYVQIGSYLRKENALQAQQEAEEKFGTKFIIALNRANNLYAVRTGNLADRNNALSILFSVIHSQFGSALVLTEEQKDTSIETAKPEQKDIEYYSIQLGAFSTEQKAETFAENTKQKTGRDAEVAYDEKSSLYKVYISADPRESSREFALGELDQITRYPGLSNAFITRRTARVEEAVDSHQMPKEYYTLQLGAFSNKEDAEAFAGKSEQRLNMPLEVQYDTRLDLFKVYTAADPEASTKEAASRKLRRVSRYPAYSNTFITKRVAMVPSDEIDRVEESTFTYEIHIQGVTPQSEQAFLSSVLDGNNTDTKLNKPSEDLVVFRDIKTWEEALKLKEKLSQISSIGRPVIVLIKNRK